MSDNLFCKIFVHGKCDLKELASFTSAFGEVDILKNDNSDPAKTSGEDGFLYFPYLIETNFNNIGARPKYIEQVSHLLNELWSNGFRAVAACDFEDELPFNGGILRADNNVKQS